MFLLADSGSTFWDFLSNIPWWAWIPLVAIVMGGIREIVKVGYRHQERLAMIRQGMHPDQYKQQQQQ